MTVCEGHRNALWLQPELRARLSVQSHLNQGGNDVTSKHLRDRARGIRRHGANGVGRSAVWASADPTNPASDDKPHAAAPGSDAGTFGTDTGAVAFSRGTTGTRGAAALIASGPAQVSTIT